MKLTKTLIMLAVMAALLLAAVPAMVSAGGHGDYDYDNKVDTNDVRVMMTDLARKDEITTRELLWGDMNYDSKLTTSDARDLLKGLMTDKFENAAKDNLAKPSTGDWFGDKAISIIGDSITFGSGAASDKTDTWSNSNATGGLSEYGFVAYLKKTLKANCGGNLNYGFVSAVPTAWTKGYIGTDLHTFPTSSKDGDVAYWTDTDIDNEWDNNMLGRIGYTCSTPSWKSLTYSIRKDYVNQYNYFCVYYYTDPNGGDFVVSKGSDENGKGLGDVNNVYGSNAYISTKRAGDPITLRTALYPISGLSKDGNGNPKIIICNGTTTNPVTIVGIGYYKDRVDLDSSTSITVNNYARGGSMLTPMTDFVLDQAAQAETLMVGLGYNDAVWGHVKNFTKEQFSDRINFLIEVCNQYGTNVIVNDYLWDNYDMVDTYQKWSTSIQMDVDEKSAFFHEELKRLARETNGIYINYKELLGEDVVRSDSFFAGDMTHPNKSGHLVMAKYVVAAFGFDSVVTSW